MPTDLFGQPITRKRRTKRWTPEGVTIYVYGGMFPDPVPVTVPIVGNKLETFYAAVDTDRTLHLVAESEQWGLNAVNYAKRLSKAGYHCRCYIGELTDEEAKKPLGFFWEVAGVVKKTAAQKRAMKKLGIRD